LASIRRASLSLTRRSIAQGPGALHHLAFKVESKAEVDRLAVELERIGANIVDGPCLFPQHGSDYYAVFFKDPDGIKYEIVCSGT